MVRLQTANVGSYPRVGDSRDEQKLRRAISRFKQGEISEDELTDVQYETIRDVIEEQENAGLDQVTDGMIRWYCPFSHIARKLEGVEIDGLVRYFDTNFYFRQPRVHESPQRDGSIVGEEFEVASEASSTSVRQVLTGPFTLAKYSLFSNGSHISRRELAFDYADALAEEITDVANRGADIVQLNEHGLRDADDDQQKQAFVDAIERIDENIPENTTLSVAFSYGSPSEGLPLLSDLPVDEAVVDLVYDRDVAQLLLEHPSDQQLVLGVLNARNTKLEDPAEEAERLAPIVNDLNQDDLTLSPSTGLELLPRDRAQDKLDLLVDLKQQLQKQI